MAMLAILCLPLMMLGFTALATVLSAGAGGSRECGSARLHRDPLRLHSAAAKNGSAFAGLSGNTRSTT